MAHATIDFLLVHEPLPFAGFSDAPWNAEEWKLEDKYLETIAAEISAGAGVPTTHNVMRGEASEMIDMRARDLDADLIVLTSHGRTGLSRAWLGSVAHGVLRRSQVPVLMLRPHDGKADRKAAHHLFKHILVPLDGSAFSADVVATRNEGIAGVHRRAVRTRCPREPQRDANALRREDNSCAMRPHMRSQSFDTSLSARK